MCKKALTAEIASNIEMDDKISEDQTGAVFSGEFNGSGASQEKACLAETGVCPGDNSLSAQVQGYPLAAPLEYISSFSPQKAVSQGNRILVGAGQEYILQAPLVKGATYNWKLDISRPGESRRILARAPLVPSFFEAGFQAMVNGSIVMTGQTAVEVVASRPLFSIKERILPYPFVWPLNIDQKYSEEIGQQKGSYYLSTLLVQRLLTISGVLLSSVEAEEENRNAAMEKFTAIPFTGQIDEGSLRVNGPGKSCLLAEVTAQGTVVARPVNYLVVAVPLLQAISIGDGNTGFVPQHYLLFRPRDGWRFGRRYIVALNDNLEIVKGLPVEKSYALSTGTNVQKDSLTKYNPDLARHLDKLITSLNDPDFVRNNVVIIYDFEVLND